MNREQEIVNFLKAIQTYALNNNEFVDERLVYSTLEAYGFNETEMKIGTEPLFGAWLQRFENTPNIDVFQSESQAHFLQFQNGRTAQSKHLKLYVSLAPNAIYDGVNKIFDFIAKNNMKTSSKVADRVRSDEIVLRMESTDDAEKLINFINGDSFLRENARTTNPFLNRDGIVGIGYDDLLSYNATFSHFIADYLNTKIPNYSDYLEYIEKSNRFRFSVPELLNTIKRTSPKDFEEFSKNKDNEKYKKFVEFAMKNKEINYDDFVNFLNNKYINLFQNQMELGAFMETPLFKANLDRIRTCFGVINNPELYVINNYRIVFEIMLNNTYMDSYKNIYGKIDESKDIFNKMTQVDRNSLLNEFIVFAYEKYNHDINAVTSILKSYADSSNVNAITRDNDYRNKFIYNLNPKQVNIITNYDIGSYVESLINIEKTVLIEESLSFSDIDFDMFIGGLKTTYDAHGYYQVKSGIEKMLQGNFKVMSNGEEGFRNYFLNKYNTDQLKVLANKFVEKIINGRTIQLDQSIGETVTEILINEYGFGSQDRGSR